MVQHSDPPGLDPEPSERSPLLSKPANTNGHDVSVSAVEVAAAGHIAGNGTNGSVPKPTTTGGDEESQEPSADEADEAGRVRHVAKIISVLLIGIFVAHADGSIMLATHPIIASEFNDLENSSWLITGFSLAAAATQALYGKLSDIYGRKRLVLIAYVIFVIGCAIVGAGQTMWQVILGRVISGAGGAGMAGLVSILITDLLPIREVAQWRAYVNLVATFGRSIGGPLGGWLVDVVGWRWSFYGQVPPLILAIILVSFSLPNSTAPKNAESSQPEPEPEPEPQDNAASNKSKLQRVDFKGAILFALVILTLLLPIELGGVKLPWSHPAIYALFASSAILLVLFIAVERRQAEPILPLEIFHRRDAVFSFAIIGCQTAAQLGLMFSVPLYFQITARVSNTVSGAHLVPAVVGNALGGIISGVLIKRSGRYKPLILLATTLSSLSYLLLMLRWHGHTNLFESLYIFPGGFGTGVAQSAVFVSLQAVIAHPSHLAPAISFMYLTTTVALTIGLPLSDTVMRGVLRRGLRGRLVGLGLGGEEVGKIIESTVSDVDFIDRVSGSVREAIVASYVDGLWWSHGVSFIFSATGFVLALFIRQRPLDGPRA
ncbi:major facilitator superfamily domain-containing protein [Dichotomopilus funicola]|uniref:Major facilitator superfamily domain-containing protein n=1 Tax=Dichotomopilus funicola TaxID=1934379 RepID=A0AAN6ZMB8_9PEZI|nr:major facilitator superfamily domain-containing protein [Dichotomopilus funicola]